jgi:hypothetical protein
MKVLVKAALPALLLGLAGCHATVDEKAADNAAATLENAAESAGGAIENAADTAAGKVENAADSLGNVDVDVRTNAGNDSSANKQ